MSGQSSQRVVNTYNNRCTCQHPCVQVHTRGPAGRMMRVFGEVRVRNNTLSSACELRFNELKPHYRLGHYRFSLPAVRRSYSSIVIKARTHHAARSAPNETRGIATPCSPRDTAIVTLVGAEQRAVQQQCHSLSSYATYRRISKYLISALTEWPRVNHFRKLVPKAPAQIVGGVRSCEHRHNGNNSSASLKKHRHLRFLF